MSTQSELESVIERIKKLNAIRSENSGATENEVAQAAAHIKKLLLKYNLSLSECVSEDSPKKPSFKKTETFNIANNPPWNRALCYAIDAICETRHFSSYQKDGVMIYFVGNEMNSAVAKELYFILRKTIARLWTTFQNEAPALGISPNRDHYKLGVASRLQERARKAAQMDSPSQQAASNALVVVTKDALDKHMKDVENVRTRPARQTPVDMNSYMRGRRDGEKVDLGKDRRIKA